MPSSVQFRTDITFSPASPFGLGLANAWFIPDGRVTDANALGRRLEFEQQGAIRKYRTARLKLWNKFIGDSRLRWVVIPQFLPIDPPPAQWEPVQTVWFSVASQTVNIVLPVRDRRIRYVIINVGGLAIPQAAEPDLLWQWTETYE